MSVWNHLPLELHGAVFEARFPLWPGDVVYWHWERKPGLHEQLVRSSLEWAFFDPLADVMRRHLSWWTLTNRDDLLRNNLTMVPWYHGNLEFTLSTGWQGWPKGPPA